MRRGDIEFRWSDCNNAHELVKWQTPERFGRTCYVIAFFDRTQEGYNMRTIGDRFFEDHDAWIVGKHALAFLNDTPHELEENANEP